MLILLDGCRALAGLLDALPAELRCALLLHLLSPPLPPPSTQLSKSLQPSQQEPNSCIGTASPREAFDEAVGGRERQDSKQHLLLPTQQESGVSLPTVPPEVVGLLLQRLRRDVATNCSNNMGSKVASAATSSGRELHRLGTAPGTAAQGRLGASCEDQEGSDPHLQQCGCQPLALCHFPIPEMPQQHNQHLMDEPRGCSLQGDGAGRELQHCSSEDDNQQWVHVLSSPFPLLLACSLTMQNLQLAPSGSAEGDCLLQHDGPAAPHQLCLPQPVALHADVCASALSLVRLIALRLHTYGAQQEMRVWISSLHQRVLLPLSAWLNAALTDLADEASKASVQQKQLEEEEEGQAGQAAEEPSRHSTSLFAPLHVLPETVVDFTALSRLACAVEAILELNWM